MARLEVVRFDIKRYRNTPLSFANDLVAELPGLLITQFEVPSEKHPDGLDGTLALRFDFTDDWYSVVAYLNGDKSPTGHYRIRMQAPLHNEGGVWKSYELVLGMEVRPNGDYMVTGEEEFCAAVEEGWMRVYAAANAREALRKLCGMLDEGQLPQEVMDAVCG